MEEGGDRTFFVETPLCGKFQHVDAAERAIRGILNQLLEGVHGVGIDRLAQNRKQIFGFAHGPILCRIACGEAPASSGPGDVVVRLVIW